MAKKAETKLFVPMKTIEKKATFSENNCTDWVATEKVHGASFQFFTNDGETVSVASRRNVLNRNGSFQKCNLQEFHDRHHNYIRRMYSIVETEDRWLSYRTQEEKAAICGVTFEEEKVEENEEETQNNQNDDDDNEKSNTETYGGLTQAIPDAPETTVLRIYGELYGGGGVNEDKKGAIQKEILYSDDYRFYLFGITINRKWVTVAEMNDLCQQAGFPYFATPVCEPKATLAELTDWLGSTGFMSSKSRLTDRTDNFKTEIEGVVMTPLSRKDYRLHAIKLLSNAFNDVRNAGNGTNQKLNYCTKARYYSVISKLDIHEREDAEMVADMYIADILKESGETTVSNNKRKNWRRFVMTWLAKDGYIKKEDGQCSERKGRVDGHGAAAVGDGLAEAESITENTDLQNDTYYDHTIADIDIGGLFD